MLEKLKEEVYRANMDLPKYGWLRLPGEMSAASTEKKDFLSSNQAVWIMIN